MKAMLWKELRENLKWAVLAMIGLGLAEFYAMNQQQFFGFYMQQGAPLCKSSFLMITTFGCAAVGLVLGLVQLLPEQRRDQWAALLHRPVPRDTIFFGKAIAGFLLYVLATVLPFLACIWYVDTPNHFAAAFTPQMVRPGVADIVAGSMYYFAALFVALRRGHWFGTRALGFLTAVSGSFIVSTNYILFRVAIEAAIFTSVLLCIAAWGAMRTNGSFRVQPWLARVALLAVIFYGVCCAGEIVGMIWGAFFREEYYFGNDYRVDVDGRPLISKTAKDGHNTFTDLDGKPIDDPRLTKGSSYRYLLNFSRISSYIGDPHGVGVNENYYGYRISETYMAQTVGSYGVPGEVWYYLPRQRYFVGYNQYSRVRLGTLGQDGLAPGYRTPAPFREPISTAESYQIPNFVDFGQVVYYIDFEEHTAQAVFSAPMDTVFGSAPFTSYNDDLAVRGLAAVALTHDVRVIDKTGKVLATLAYDQDVSQWGNIDVAIKSTADRVFLRYSPSFWIPWPKRGSMPSYLEERDLQGNVLHSYTLPPFPPQYSPRTWNTYIRECLYTPAFCDGEIVYMKIGAMFGSKRLAQRLHDEFGPGWGHTRDVQTRIMTLSTILALLTLFWARRVNLSWSRAWKWAAFVLAFNLAGFITFRLVADWPVRVACPACQRKRAIIESTCPHCHAPWPTPMKDGTEIFEAVPEALPVTA